MAKRNVSLQKIAKLNPNLTNFSSWKIKATISFNNENIKVKPTRTGGKICRVTLEDESGKITGVAWGNIAECVALNITHNGKYYIKGADIREAHSTNNVGHKCEVHFILNETEFEDVSSGRLFRLDDEAVNSCKEKVCKLGTSSATCGSGGMNLKPSPLVEVLASQNLSDSKEFDILAVVKKTEKAKLKKPNKTMKNGKRTKFYSKKVTIIDESGEVTLWLGSEMKKKFSEHSWMKNSVLVIAVKGCVWTKYDSTVILTAYLKDVIKEEKLEMPAMKSRIKKLKSWYFGKKKKASKGLVSKGNKSQEQSTNNNRSATKARSITIPPVDQKGAFSKPDGKRKRTESLGSGSENLNSRDVTETNRTVAGKKRKAPRQSTSKGSTQNGEKLRKTDDNCSAYINGEIIYQMQVDKGIGCIQFASNNDCGTGFRVGSKYVITAFHVMEKILIPFWKQVYKLLTGLERKYIKWTKNNLPADGSWNLSKLFSSLDPIRQEMLLRKGKGMITDSCQIEFGFKKITRGTFLKFSHDPVTFASQKFDVVILELAENEAIPEPLILTDCSIPGARLHVIGHPNGVRLQIDSECRIIEDKAELSEIVRKGTSFFIGQGIDSEEVKEDYAPCKLSKDHILFHCSKSIAHGASGSPLFVVSDEARVLGMLQTGHPKLYYNCKKPTEVHPKLLLESGISMAKVRSLLENSLPQLSEELFSEGLCSQMTQDVKPMEID